MPLCPYLFFDGRCEEAFTRYQQVLGGRITAMLRHAGTPAEAHVPPEWRDKIMHACLELEGGMQLMASDAAPPYFRPPQGFSVQLSVGTVEEAERIFAALAEGGNVTMPLAPTFWATRFGMLTDRFGVPWMLNHGQPG
ncbi:MAG: VOC family protein [Paracraurococcus sp.]